MTAFDLIDRIRGYDGSVEIVEGGKLRVTARPDDVRLAVLNVDLMREALDDPDRFPCRKFISHPARPTLPCRACGALWPGHPRDLRAGYELQARAIVAGAIATTIVTERTT